MEGRLLGHNLAPRGLLSSLKRSKYLLFFIVLQFKFLGDVFRCLTKGSFSKDATL